MAGKLSSIISKLVIKMKKDTDENFPICLGRKFAIVVIVFAKIATVLKKFHSKYLFVFRELENNNS